MWYRLIRPLLFSLPPEASHELTLGMLKFIQQIKGCKAPNHVIGNPVRCFGLTFPNAVGLAAGLDKNADCLKAWQALGFGFIEVGTVTPTPQYGNPKPRLFRIKPQCLINRMGFNNNGVDALIEKIKDRGLMCPLGVNIGKNLHTPLDKAGEDYLICFQKVYPFADYITVNVSSPNTPGLKSLQQGDMLTSIILPLKKEQQKQADKLGKKVPILVKLSPDLALDEIPEIIDNLINLGVEGVIATNTAARHDLYFKGDSPQEVGGLSGELLFERSTQIVKLIYQQTGDALPIVAVGGIMNVAQAKAKLDAGAKLIQLYSGLIYHGPGLIKEIINNI